jgi:hypothetical protein
MIYRVLKTHKDKIRIKYISHSTLSQVTFLFFPQAHCFPADFAVQATAPPIMLQSSERQLRQQIPLIVIELVTSSLEGRPEDRPGTGRSRNFIPDSLAHRVNRAECIKIRTTVIRKYEAKIQTDGSFDLFAADGRATVVTVLLIAHTHTHEHTRVSVAVYKVLENRQREPEVIDSSTCRGIALKVFMFGPVEFSISIPGFTILLPWLARFASISPPVDQFDPCPPLFSICIASVSRVSESTNLPLCIFLFHPSRKSKGR